MKRVLTLSALLLTLIACTALPTMGTSQAQPVNAPTSTQSPNSLANNTPQANMPNPASIYCQQQGFKSEIRTVADGSQSGVCIFPNGSECDEWAYFRGECGPSILAVSSAVLTALPTAMPIDSADYQGWWTYTHPDYNFSIMLPDGWIVNEVTANDPLMNGHMLILGGQVATGGTERIRMTFRRIGENIPLWPTGVGPGEFVEQGTLDVAGEPARRVLLVCPSLTNPDGEVTSIWYRDAEQGQPNIVRGDLEFAFIFHTESHCEPSHSLSGKIQHMGEMIITSLKAP